MTGRRRSITKFARWGAPLAVLGILAAPASAQTFRWTSQGDALTMDPHAWNEGLTVAITGMIYESLVTRDTDLDLEPELATAWEQVEGGWKFTLREGVTFQGGETFDAEDVKFSFERARAPFSDWKTLVAGVTSVEIVDPLTVILRTQGINPILPEELTTLFIMDKGWAEAQEAAVPQDPAAKEPGFAALNANGTGPYVLVSRAPGERTELSRNNAWWGWDDAPGNILRIVYRPLAEPAARIAALMSGEVDFVLDPPLDELERIKAADGIKIESAPEIRSIFLGMNLGATALESSDIKDRNPFADARVREAMNLAVDRKAIQRVVMSGRSFPSGMIAPPGVLGNTPDNDAAYPFDLDRARGLMEEAGYKDGFSVRLDCPDDRYTKDANICQAVVGMLEKIGVKVTLVSAPKAEHFLKVRDRKTDFYMLGWGAPSLDSRDVLANLVAGDGPWNATGYANARVDDITRLIETETDIPKRTAEIMEAWDIVKKEMPYIPLHHQVIAWAMSDKVEAPIAADDALRPRFVVMSQD